MSEDEVDLYFARRKARHRLAMKHYRSLTYPSRDRVDPASLMPLTFSEPMSTLMDAELETLTEMLQEEESPVTIESHFSADHSSDAFLDNEKMPTLSNSDVSENEECDTNGLVLTATAAVSVLILLFGNQQDGSNLSDHLFAAKLVEIFSEEIDRAQFRARIIIAPIRNIRWQSAVILDILSYRVIGESKAYLLHGRIIKTESQVWNLHRATVTDRFRKYLKISPSGWKLMIGGTWLPATYADVIKMRHHSSHVQIISDSGQINASKFVASVVCRECACSDVWLDFISAIYQVIGQGSSSSKKLLWRDADASQCIQGEPPRLQVNAQPQLGNEHI